MNPTEFSPISIDEETLESGWAEVPFSEVIKTHYQYYDIVGKRWKLSTYFTSENCPANGRTIYRKPVTFSAKCEAYWAARGKYWKILMGKTRV